MGNRYDHPWSEYEIEILKRCWQEGMQIAHIMKKLGAGITKNAIITKAAHLDLGDRPNAPAPDKPEPTRVEKRPDAFVVGFTSDKQRKATEAAARTAGLRSMETYDRAKLIRLAEVPFLKRRLRGEPDSGRWV